MSESGQSETLTRRMIDVRSSLSSRHCSARRLSQLRATSGLSPFVEIHLSTLSRLRLGIVFISTVLVVRVAGRVSELAETAIHRAKKHFRSHSVHDLQLTAGAKGDLDAVSRQIHLFELRRGEISLHTEAVL